MENYHHATIIALAAKLSTQEWWLNFRSCSKLKIKFSFLKQSTSIWANLGINYQFLDFETITIRTFVLVQS